MRLDASPRSVACLRDVHCWRHSGGKSVPNRTCAAVTIWSRDGDRTAVGGAIVVKVLRAQAMNPPGIRSFALREPSSIRPARNGAVPPAVRPDEADPGIACRVAAERHADDRPRRVGPVLDAPGGDAGRVVRFLQQLAAVGCTWTTAVPPIEFLHHRAVGWIPKPGVAVTGEQGDAVRLAACRMRRRSPRACVDVGSGIAANRPNRVGMVLNQPCAVVVAGAREAARDRRDPRTIDPDW